MLADCLLSDWLMFPFCLMGHFKKRRSNMPIQDINSKKLQTFGFTSLTREYRPDPPARRPIN
jgi:hypothetical protein